MNTFTTACAAGAEPNCCSRRPEEGRWTTCLWLAKRCRRPSVSNRHTLGRGSTGAVARRQIWQGLGHWQPRTCADHRGSCEADAQLCLTVVYRRVRRRGPIREFLLHCLLNQKSPLPGTAVCRPVRSAVDPYIDDGIGVVQMPCSEQRTWGGVLKGQFLWISERGWAVRATQPLLADSRTYLRLGYGAWRERSLANLLGDQVAADLPGIAQPVARCHGLPAGDGPQGRRSISVARDQEAPALLTGHNRDQPRS